MAFQRFTFPDIGIDIEFELLSGLFKIFEHKESRYFAQAAVTTGEAEQGIIKGFMGPQLPYMKRKKIDEALRRVMAALNYTDGSFQRKKNGVFITKKVDLRGYRIASHHLHPHHINT